MIAVLIAVVLTCVSILSDEVLWYCRLDCHMSNFLFPSHFLASQSFRCSALLSLSLLSCVYFIRLFAVSCLSILPVAPGATAGKRTVLRCLQEAMREKEELHAWLHDVEPQFKFADWLPGWQVANLMHQEIGCIGWRPQHQLMQMPKLIALVWELAAIKFSVHNCLNRQSRLTCRVVVYQFSGSAPIFDAIGSDAWAQYVCMRPKRVRMQRSDLVPVDESVDFSVRCDDSHTLWLFIKFAVALGATAGRRPFVCVGCLGQCGKKRVVRVMLLF